jgi:hypothetical protein
MAGLAHPVPFLRARSVLRGAPLPQFQRPLPSVSVTGSEHHAGLRGVDRSRSSILLGAREIPVWHEAINRAKAYGTDPAQAACNVRDRCADSDRKSRCYPSFVVSIVDKLLASQ